MCCLHMLSTFSNLNSCITYHSVSESFRKIIPDFNNTPVLGCTLIVKPKTNIMLTRIFYSQLTICSRGDAISKEKHAQHYTSFLTTYRHSTKSSTQHYSDIWKKTIYHKPGLVQFCKSLLSGCPKKSQCNDINIVNVVKTEDTLDL